MGEDRIPQRGVGESGLVDGSCAQHRRYWHFHDLNLDPLAQQVDFDWAGADASIQRAVELEPGNPEVVRAAASSAGILGRLDEALQLVRRAVDLDRLNADSWARLAEIEFSMGQLDEAAADMKKALELNRDVYDGHIVLACRHRCEITGVKF